MKQRNRRIGSIKSELLKKSREAALAAVQIFNNPNITFKSETYVVLMIVAWTYLLHAHYRNKKLEYRYFDKNGKKRNFHRTKHGAFKYWELERCLNEDKCPIDKDTANNLRFLIGLRHEIEHQMTTRIDDVLSARFQACCLNYNDYIKRLFDPNLGIERHLSFSLQFSSISTDQKDSLEEHHDLPTHIKGFIESFDNALSDKEYGSPKYAYRILFVPKTANRKGQADKVIEFVKADSELAQDINKTYAVIKETEKPKYLPNGIVSIMKKEGYPKFNVTAHTNFWKDNDAKNESKGYGVQIAKTWYWYEPWVEEVRKHCATCKQRYQ